MGLGWDPSISTIMVGSIRCPVRPVCGTRVPASLPGVADKPELLKAACALSAVAVVSNAMGQDFQSAYVIQQLDSRRVWDAMESEFELSTSLLSNCLKGGAPCYDALALQTLLPLGLIEPCLMGITSPSTIVQRWRWQTPGWTALSPPDRKCCARATASSDTGFQGWLLPCCGHLH